MRVNQYVLARGVCLALTVAVTGLAQTAAPDSPASPGALTLRAQTVVPRLVNFNGVLRDATGKPLTGNVEVTFALYVIEAGGDLLWIETQSVQAHEQGRHTVLLGAMHTSSGATRDLVQFESKKVASRTYTIELGGMGAGEYGFLPPGAVLSSSGGSVGKMYTFRVVE